VERFTTHVESSNIDKKIKAIREFQANDRVLEDSRQQFELAQLKKQQVMQLEAQEHSAREARKNREFMERENRLNREFQSRLTEYIQQCENIRMQKSCDFQQFLFEERKKLDIELQRRSHEFQLQLAVLEWQMTRQTDEYKRILDNGDYFSAGSGL